MKKLTSALLASAISLTAAQAFAADTKLRVAHTNAANEVQDMGLQRLNELLTAKTGGTFGLEIFPGGVLGGETEQIEGVMLGTLDLSLTANAALSNYVEPLQVFDLPFLFADIPAMSERVSSPEVFGTLQAAANDAGFQLLAVYSSGVRHIMTTKPVNAMSDLSSMKIRTMQNPIHLEAFRAYGANPTPMAYSEVYGAMQANVVDGAENAATNYNGEKLYEVAPNYATIGWMNMTAPLVMSKDAFDGLPSVVQTALMEAGAESAAWQHGYVHEKEQPLLEALAAKNVKITRPDTAPFIAASQPLYNSVARTDVQKALLGLLRAE
ncbi:TRAP transporter substrate-binding protein [Falsigemmobacter faecalis]|uniref:TRAP transporter substrate-binding protein n=1 Tax=Falsigemmobacter faecalis TaxID=2488730 RepID=A0A3P3D3K5_9RHOB|nr:TRAP transporter substrate-binding protein [Falsigemmobacter faecalis]RRH69007.1 TRAP transporter substrate-binding protein [Falsigemmobacter faecalis]